MIDSMQFFIQHLEEYIGHIVGQKRAKLDIREAHDRITSLQVIEEKFSQAAVTTHAPAI